MAVESVAGGELSRQKIIIKRMSVEQTKTTKDFNIERLIPKANIHESNRGLYVLVCWQVQVGWALLPLPYQQSRIDITAFPIYYIPPQPYTVA